VISDSDIWRTAHAVIQQRCEFAELCAAQRADARLAEGDLDGYCIWKRVLATITAIRWPMPVSGERVN